MDWILEETTASVVSLVVVEVVMLNDRDTILCRKGVPRRYWVLDMLRWSTDDVNKPTITICACVVQA
jgi:hypothetical protein